MTSCAYVTDCGQCKRAGTTVVAGVADEFCKQHARIVATEPGGSGVMRHRPQGVVEIVRHCALATTQADITRLVSAIAEQADLCRNSFGLLPEIGTALAAARARVRGALR